MLPRSTITTSCSIQSSKGISKMQDVIESIIKSRVDGVILFNDNFSLEEMEVLNEYQIPMVVVGSKITETKIGNVGNVYINFEKWLMI